MIKSQWRQVQALAEQFWNQWRNNTTSQKWNCGQPSLKEGDVVLMKNMRFPRAQLPISVIEQCFSSQDDRIRKVYVRVVKNQKPLSYTRPFIVNVLVIVNASQFHERLVYWCLRYFTCELTLLLLKVNWTVCTRYYVHVHTTSAAKYGLP